MHSQPEKSLLDTVQNTVAGQLAQVLHNTALTTLPRDTTPPQAAVHGLPTPPRRWPGSALVQEHLVIGTGLLLLLAGTATLLRQKPLLPVTAVSQPGLVPVASVPALASQALAQGDWSQAEVLLQRLVQQTEPQVHKVKGNAGLAAAAFARGEAQQALVLAGPGRGARPGDRLQPRDPVATSCGIEGKIGAARLAYRTATEKANAFPWQQAIAAHRLGRIYAAEGFPGTALQYYDRAMNLAPQMATVYINKAQVLEQVGRRPEAIELYRQASQMDSDNRQQQCCSAWRSSSSNSLRTGSRKRRWPSGWRHCYASMQRAGPLSIWAMTGPLHR